MHPSRLPPHRSSRLLRMVVPVIETDVDTPDGRVLHVYDSGQTPNEGVVHWQHGAGMCGLPPGPLVERAQALGVRVIGHDRPEYGGSTPRPGRSVADGAGDLMAALDGLAAESAVTIGLSAGAMHALGAVALHPSRITAAAVVGGRRRSVLPGWTGSQGWRGRTAPSSRRHCAVVINWPAISRLRLMSI